MRAGRKRAPRLGLIGNTFTVDWSQYSADWTETVRTSVDLGRLRALGERIVCVPADFTCIRALHR